MFCILVVMVVGYFDAIAQEPMQSIPKAQKHRERLDSVDVVIQNINESLDSVSHIDISKIDLNVPKDSLFVADSIHVSWKPNPKTALWLALAIPGGGQIYNRKYWKLPIIYGGFLGCVYAIKWNNT
ncbi:MAG: hypothetical protein KBT06_05115, partial [Prevotellaceae bacterium]|nr:hypothetical protein [Candidatus Colivivens equi]